MKARPIQTSAQRLATLTRRHFLKSAGSVAVTIGVGLTPAQTSPMAGRSRSGGLIDTNVTLGRWPFRRLPLDDTVALVAKLRQHGVTQAWAGSFDGVFHQNLAASNTRLAEECRRQGRGVLVPFGSVNPRLPGWEEEFRRCVEQLEMPGLRLHPNYHGYELDDPALVKLLSLASERCLSVQVAVSMEDERMQHPLARVPHVNAAPLVDLLPRFPALPVLLLNWQRAVNAGLLRKLAAAGNVYFEIATLEGVGGVANLLTQIPSERVLFGSHAPWFYFESALLKLQESVLGAAPDLAVRSGNARRLLAQA